MAIVTPDLLLISQWAGNDYIIIIIFKDLIVLFYVYGAWPTCIVVQCMHETKKGCQILGAELQTL